MWVTYAHTLDQHEAGVASARQALGDQWDRLYQQGREMTGNQIIDAACDELATIDDNEPERCGGAS